MASTQQNSRCQGCYIGFRDVNFHTPTPTSSFFRSVFYSFMYNKNIFLSVVEHALGQLDYALLSKKYVKNITPLANW